MKKKTAVPLPLARHSAHHDKINNKATNSHKPPHQLIHIHKHISLVCNMSLQQFQSFFRIWFGTRWGCPRVDMCPKVMITKDEFEKWCEPWKRSLIVKLLGKKVTLNFLKMHLEHLFKDQECMPCKLSTWTMTACGVIRIFNLEEFSYEHQEGPWMITDHYIVTQQVLKNKLRCVATWIRVLWLHLEFYNAHLLWRIGNLVRKTNKIGLSMSLTRRGRFVRIYVEINLNKQLLPRFKPKGKIYWRRDLHSVLWVRHLWSSHGAMFTRKEGTKMSTVRW